jgi:uncharacterized protein
MTSPSAVCNSSPLIALHQIDQLDLLERLLGTVAVPPAIVQETRRTLVLPPWIKPRPLDRPVPVGLSRIDLGPGETEALALALEISPNWIILDDLRARQIAHDLRLPVIGVLGLLLAAKRRGLLPEVRPVLDGLIKNRFHIRRDLYERVVYQAGEQPAR